MSKKRSRKQQKSKGFGTRRAYERQKNLTGNVFGIKMPDYTNLE